MLKLFRPALVLFVTTLVITGLLAATYSYTRDIIREREEKTLRDARISVLKEADSFEEADLSLFGFEPSVESVFVGKDKDGKTAGAVVTVNRRGYGDKIRMSVGVTADGTIQGVVILENQETPGLGGKISEAGFISQFKALFSEEELTVAKKAKSEAYEIEAISGATISSSAVISGVNTAKKAAMEIMKAGEGS